MEWHPGPGRLAGQYGRDDSPARDGRELRRRHAVRRGSAGVVEFDYWHEDRYGCQFDGDRVVAIGLVTAAR
ncbi:hypothetical protein [Natranaeroarchaeum aerophilus]|uniref:Uncharacterized protein n=1 Tax=Natranaeroarchaeum aerophilus TaxID=2917711 RepID=A0AAE3K3U6_9EURY|nr:hypothetical protein [Natranaeroarchaeum aerophilus]MCL9812065.1 hypothetical protein [Natranaeroarchaeum aerophilus]